MLSVDHNTLINVKHIVAVETSKNTAGKDVVWITLTTGKVVSWTGDPFKFRGLADTTGNYLFGIIGVRKE